MNHGNHTTAEILLLIANGHTSKGDRVYSTDYRQWFTFDGVVFVGDCDCQIIGSCPASSSDCKATLDSYGEFVIS